MTSKHERPIIFSGPLVRAILEGRKTQTRRIIKHRDCPYGQPGARLWVRETWAVDAPLEQVRRERDDIMRVEPFFGHGPYYRADGVHENTGLTWRTAIYMPRWACRLVLELTAVRVERLQEITLDDINAEGISSSRTRFIDHANARGHWADVWDSINAKRAPWASNPWVWVLEFKTTPPASTKGEQKCST